ncbi:MAG: hypothetical protein ACRCV3_04535 [Desulfovibrionaceae bacterium]
MHVLFLYTPFIITHVILSKSHSKRIATIFLQGDILSIGQGTTSPVGGIIIKEEGSIDESMLSWESIAQYKEVNQECHSDTTIQDSSFIMLIRKIHSEIYPQKILFFHSCIKKHISKSILPKVSLSPRIIDIKDKSHYYEEILFKRNIYGKRHIFSTKYTLCFLYKHNR